MKKIFIKKAENKYSPYKTYGESPQVRNTLLVGTQGESENSPVVSLKISDGETPYKDLGELLTNVVTVTYNELLDLINKEKLTQGRKYVIIDFHSTFNEIKLVSDAETNLSHLEYTGLTYNGYNEPLLVSAISNQKIESTAYFLDYQASGITYSVRYAEEITYTIDNLFSGYFASTKGTILRRYNRVANIDVDFDYFNLQYIVEGEWRKKMVSVDNFNSGNVLISSTNQYDNGRIPIVVNSISNSSLILNGTFEGNNGGILSFLAGVIDHSIIKVTSWKCAFQNLESSFQHCHIKAGIFKLKTKSNIYFKNITVNSLNNITNYEDSLNYISELDTEILNKSYSISIVRGSNHKLYKQYVDDNGTYQTISVGHVL